MYVLKLKSLFYSFIEKNKKKEFQDNIQTNAKTNRRDIFFMGITCAFRTKGIKKTQHTHYTSMKNVLTNNITM